MKELKLVLKKKWYDMIASGEKKEEYRDIKPYWTKRLYTKNPYYGKIRKNSLVTFYLGYGKYRPSMTFWISRIVYDEGKPEWGAEPGKIYYVIKLGERYER